jgi:hypothetical protein
MRHRLKNGAAGVPRGIDPAIRTIMVKSTALVLLLIALGFHVVPPAPLLAPWWTTGPGAALAQTPSSSAPECLELKTRIGEIFATQRPDGYLTLTGEDSLFYYHPVMASLSLDVYRQTRDTVFLERSHTALTAYFNYLLVHHDADNDFLIERTAYRHFPADPSAAIEGVGYNSLLALDMMSLSRICLELERPVDALFWYQGMKTISAGVIASTYDNAAGFFLPTSALPSGAAPTDRVAVYLGLSVLPTYFHRDIGDNISRSILRSYLLTTRTSLHGTALNYLDWNFDDAALHRTHADERLLRSILLLGALEWNGLTDDASRHAGQIREHITDSAGNSAQTSTKPGAASSTGISPNGIYEKYLRCFLANSASHSLFPEHYELELLDVLVFQKALLNAGQTAQLRNGIVSVGEYLVSNDAGDAGAQAVMQSIREIYFGISTLREKWRAHSLYPPQIRDKLPGFDIYSATAELWDDVIETLRDAETTIAQTKTQTEGFGIAVTLQKEQTTPGAPVKIKCALSSMTHPLAVSSVVIFRDQAIDTLLSTNQQLEIEPGAPPHEIEYMLPTPVGTTSTIHLLRFSIEIRFANGDRHRFHWRRGIYVTEPLSYSVSFPNGTALAGGSVPIKIDVNKHTKTGAVIHAEWYSPAGLRPKEGRSIEKWMSEHTDESTLDLNILVPAPCRPGAFPFTLKLFANGTDLGTVQSSLFKHYQWLFVGPFAEKLNALDATYPPESRINLLETYAGAGRQLSWMPLPNPAYGDGGTILLGNYLPSGSVGFLYTVVHSELERAITVVLGSYAPTVMYLNGDEIMRTRGAQGGTELASNRTSVILSEGMNNILLKVLSHGNPAAFLQLGEEQDMTSDEFNNNLWELVDGYKELTRRGNDPSGHSGETQHRVTLTYNNPNANSVAVVGNFNGWSPANSTMHRNKYGDWEINLYLAPGRYAYRFLLNNSEEILDPTSSDQEPDGYGSQNSVLMVQ